MKYVKLTDRYDTTLGTCWGPGVRHKVDYPYPWLRSNRGIHFYAGYTL